MSGKTDQRLHDRTKAADFGDRWAATFSPKGYVAVVTDTTTGETRRCLMEPPWDDGSDYWWREGNFSCDCNRHGVFAHDDDADYDENHRCGDGRYRVRCETHDGVLLYEDDVRD